MKKTDPHELVMNEEVVDINEMFDVNENITNQKKEKDDIAHSEGQQTMVESRLELRRPEHQYSCKVAQQTHTSYHWHHVGLQLLGDCVHQVLRTGAVGRFCTSCCIHVRHYQILSDSSDFSSSSIQYVSNKQLLKDKDLQ